MDFYNVLPQPAKAGLVGASLGTAAVWMLSEGSLSDALMGGATFGVLSAGADYAAPMLTSDPMLQLAAAAGIGAGISLVLPVGGLLPAGLIPAASMYVARM
jgi:hypothetical protein